MAREKIPITDDEDGFVGPPPTPVRAGRQKREDKLPEPDSLSERQMVKARLLADSLFDRREGLQKQLGPPLKSSKLSSVDRKQQYKDMISSPEMLFNALAGAAIVGRDGQLRISTAMVTAFRDLRDK